MRDWKTLKKELIKNEEISREYEKLKPRYQIVSQMIEARIKRKLTQKELARKIGTKQSAIARIESGNANTSLAFLEKIAAATKSRLIIEFRTP